METCIIFKFKLKYKNSLARETNYLILVKKRGPILHFDKPFRIITTQRNSVIQVSKPNDSAGEKFSEMIRNFETINVKITQSYKRIQHYNS